VEGGGKNEKSRGSLVLTGKRMKKSEKRGWGELPSEQISKRATEFGERGERRVIAATQRVWERQFKEWSNTPSPATKNLPN